MEMIRVGTDGIKFVVMLIRSKPPLISIRLTKEQAADLLAQLRGLLPDELQNVQPFSSDSKDEDHD